MSTDFARIEEHMKVFLTYSEIFGTQPTIDEIIKDIRSIHLDEALSILSQFTVLEENSKEKFKMTLNPHVIDKSFIDSVEPFDVYNLMYAMKWFIAYGTRNPVHKFNNDFDATHGS